MVLARSADGYDMWNMEHPKTTISRVDCDASVCETLTKQVVCDDMTQMVKLTMPDMVLL